MTLMKHAMIIESENECVIEYKDDELDIGEEMEETQGDSQQSLKYWVESLEDSTFKNVNIGYIREWLEQTHRNYTDALVTVNENMDVLKTKLSDVSRSAKLWIQYLRYIQGKQYFTRAERTGNWNLHLVALSRMINLFAATRHINYAKSVRLHLQTMLDLPDTISRVYENFMINGYHTVRRSYKFWVGLW